ncbi:T9SS type A sorting domain-containing protein [Flavobacterium sp. SUN046]|uniref:T9SS type A sorting domain-containing protein n=1 Tax=Flavobacterium sp. SUN046 TaxID=3002440 RepID=UPI002DB943A5|nr:T9SS type A sorting domain-containing protein [Flavobacterium sp. SUN046]MEC4049908.1 T9SS type A sorting domain-containing protein [Flavobacterium sp. SUN046]
MNKNYFLLSLFLVVYNFSFAQIVAGDDYFQGDSCGNYVNLYSAYLYDNDTLEGVPLLSSSSPTPNLTILTDQGNVHEIVYDGIWITFYDDYGVFYTINKTTGAITAQNMSFMTGDIFTYFAYQICDQNNASNCDIGYVQIAIFSPPTYAADDDFSASPIISAQGGTTLSVLNNDMLNCVFWYNVNPINFPAGFSLDPSNGVITVAPGTIPGTYIMQYYTNNSNIANVIIVVQGSNNLVANYDSFDLPVYPGTTTLNSVISNDTLDGVVLPSGSVGVSALVSISGISINADGTISVGADVPEGVYNIPYQICLFNDPTSCSVNYAHLSVLKNGVTGTIRFDATANGCDSSDPTLSGIKVINQNNGTTYTTYSFYDGTYRAIADQGINNLSVVLPSYFTVNPSVLSYNFNTPGITNGGDFCVSSNNSVDDLEIVLIPYSNAVPGLPLSYAIAYHNKGTTALSGQINFQYDNSKMLLWTSTPAPDQSTASTVTYNFSNLQPFEYRVINKVKFHLLTPPTVDAGTNLTFSGAITPNANDFTPSDNNDSITQTVVNSLDPNDILVHEGSTITLSQASNFLHYTIHFQNLGTSEAINIKIDNDLEDKLDWSTFELVSSSHPCRVKNTDNHNEFLFENIYLPGSNNVDYSTGYVSYRVKPKSTVAVGDVLTNDAKIYFDYNAPIITNTTSTTIISNLSTASFNGLQAKLYPNPVQNKLHIDNSNIINEIEIYSLLGQKMLSKKVDAMNTDIDMSNFAEGIYTVTVKGANGESNYKVIKI